MTSNKQAYGTVTIGFLLFTLSSLFLTSWLVFESSSEWWYLPTLTTGVSTTISFVILTLVSFHQWGKQVQKELKEKENKDG